MSKREEDTQTNDLLMNDKKHFSSKKWGNILFLILLLLPLLFIRVAYIIRGYQIDFNIRSDILPWVRIILIVISLVNLGYPWFQKENALKSLRITKEITLDSQWSVFILGLFHGYAIAVYGLLIFFIGGSIPELMVFCLVSMASMIVWRIFRMPD